MIYVGYFRPYELPLANKIELFNESLTIVCTYSLICFSAFVPDARARYLCGWALIGLICFLMLSNLTMIMIQGIKIIIRAIRLRLKRCKNRKAMKVKMLDYKRKQNATKLLQQEYVKRYSSAEGFGSINR